MDDLSSLKRVMQDNGVERLFFKPLSPNDNSKNQVYFGSGFSALNVFPVEDIVPNLATRKPGFRAVLKFAWLDNTGIPHHSPKAQLILYPQYPEVRFSGFLAGCDYAPSALMNSHEEGRVLFLGIATDNMIIGYVVARNNAIARELAGVGRVNTIGVFQELELEGEDPYRKLLLDTLVEVHRKGWIDSRRLRLDGSSVPCNASNCGGYTLEAEFGITPNGRPKPDIWGWEIKQHNVSSFSRGDSGVVTLMTPEPTGGYYKEKGIEQFIQEYGYPDMLGRPDRMNFGGIHRSGYRTDRTGLTLILVGYDQNTNKIKLVGEGLALLDDQDRCAAMWHYTLLMKIWNRKHAQAVYVPSMARQQPRRQYCYGPVVQLGIGTEFHFFLRAVSAGLVYYDPGIKMEQASSMNPHIKRRSQFRIKTRDLRNLYSHWDSVDLVP